MLPTMIINKFYEITKEPSLTDNEKEKKSNLNYATYQIFVVIKLIFVLFFFFAKISEFSKKRSFLQNILIFLTVKIKPKLFDNS